MSQEYEKKDEGTHPFGEKLIAKIACTWPSRTMAVLPVRRSHTRPIASSPLCTKS